MYKFSASLYCILCEKGKGLTKSYDESPYTNRKFKKQNSSTKRDKNFLYDDLGWSVGVATAIQLVSLNRFAGA